MDDKAVLWISRFIGVHIATLIFILVRKEDFNQALFRFIFVSVFAFFAFIAYDHFMSLR